VANCVDAAVDPVQPTGANGSADRAAGIAEGAAQLTNRHDTVLTLCKVCKGMVCPRQSLVPHTGQKDCRAPILPLSSEPAPAAPPRRAAWSGSDR
jgi:hypothetical protein